MLPHIYLVTNILNGKIYIGQTNGKRNDYFAGGKIIKQALRKYGKHNFTRQILEKGNFSKKDLDILEVKYIVQYKSNTPSIGYNISKGGQGSKGYKQTQESIDKRNKSMQETFKKRGYKRTPEQIANIVKHHKGRKYNQEVRTRMSLAHTGKKLPAEQAAKIKKSVRSFYYKEFDVFDLSGNYINTFGIIKDAVKELNLPYHAKHGISNVLAGRHKSCQSYIFKYKEVINGKLD